MELLAWTGLLVCLLLVGNASSDPPPPAGSLPGFDDTPQSFDQQTSSPPFSRDAPPLPHIDENAGSSQPAAAPKYEDASTDFHAVGYNGTEYRLKRLIIRPAELKLEGALLITLIIYIIMTYRGRNLNRRLVQEWCQSYHDYLNTQFSHVGVSPGQSFISHGASLFYSFATGGNSSCRSLMIKFALRPRQDLPFIIYEEIRSIIDFSWTGRSDRIELKFDLKPSLSSQSNKNPSSNQPLNSFESKDLFVWGIVEKKVMNVLREERWDVRTFTEVKESSLLPSQFVVMSESGEITEQILRSKENGFTELFAQNSPCMQWFDSLILSGTTPTEPEISQLPLSSVPTSRTLTLRLRLPPTSPNSGQSPVHLDLIKLCFKLIGQFTNATTGPHSSSISSAKFVKRRQEISNRILEEVKKQEDKSKEEERRKKLKAMQDQKFTKMSSSEQRKFEEKERKRNLAKLSKTTVKRK